MKCIAEVRLITESAKFVTYPRELSLKIGVVVQKDK